MSVGNPSEPQRIGAGVGALTSVAKHGSISCKNSKVGGRLRRLLHAVPLLALASVAAVLGWFGACSGGGSSKGTSTPQGASLDVFLRPVDTTSAQSQALTQLSGVVYQSLEQQAWRLAQLFAGRPPTQAEYATLSQNGAKALPQLAAAWVQDKAFGERMRTVFNDVLHVSAANPSSGVAVNRLLSARDFPRREWHLEANLPKLDTVSGRSNLACNEYGFIEGTLRRIAAQADSDASVARLFQGEVLFVNQCSARALGIEDALKWPAQGDSELFVPFDVAAFRKQSPNHPLSKLRFSGLLTDFAFLHRYPYTVGNAHRSRAQLVLKHFLGVDVAALPIPPDGEAALSATPTLDDARCVSCHKILDPVANLFHNFSSRNPTRIPRAPLPELWPRGVLGQSYTESPSATEGSAESTEPLVWFAEQLAMNPAFYESMVTLVWRGLTGQEFTPGPAKRSEVAGRWRAQGASLRRLAVMLAELPEFHARDALGPTAQILGQRGFAPQQLVPSNELRDRLLQALGIQGNEALAKTFRQEVGGLTVTLGGIDHLQVTTRLKDPSPVWAASMQLLAARWSCVFAHELSRAAAISTDATDASVPSSEGNASATAQLEAAVAAAYRSTFSAALAQLFAAATGRLPSPQETDLFAELYQSSVQEAALRGAQDPQSLQARCPVPGAPDPAALSLGQSLARSGLAAAALFILLHDEVALR